MSMPDIQSVMTPMPHSIEAGANLVEAQKLMQSEGIRHLPVTDDGDLAGMVSDRDIKLMLGPDFAYPSGSELTVGDAMVRDAYVVDLETRLDLVVEHMAEEHLGSAVVTRKGRLAGVFTVTDACRVLADTLREQLRRDGGGSAA